MRFTKQQSTEIVVRSYFDGEVHCDDGPYRIRQRSGRIAAIEPATAETDSDIPLTGFALPGLVEGHCHLFLDGDEYDPAARKMQVAASPEEKTERARRNRKRMLGSGITLLMDAGDASGASLAVKRESEAEPFHAPRVRACGVALRRPGRYGSMIAAAVQSEAEIRAAIEKTAREADALKVALTGPVNLAEGRVRGRPQFDERELAAIVGLARERDLPVRVHASGVEGLAVAVGGGVDSIEHGYFVTNEILAKMRDKGIAWVPTLAPFDALVRLGERADLTGDTVDRVRRVLDGHREAVARATTMGVVIVAGSDACSIGVEHGPGLIRELVLLHEAGLPMESVLRSATSVPRERWGLDGRRIAVGAPADLIVLRGLPFDDPANLSALVAVHFGEWLCEPDRD